MAIEAVYSKAAKISAFVTLFNLLPVVVNGEYSALIIQVTMLGLLFNIIITLLLSLGYGGMKWVMLLLSVFGVLSVFNLFSELEGTESVELLNVAVKIVSIVADIYITILLFKRKPVVQPLGSVQR